MEKIKKTIARRLYLYAGIKAWRDKNTFKVTVFLFGYPVSTFSLEYTGGLAHYSITKDLPF